MVVEAEAEAEQEQPFPALVAVSEVLAVEAVVEVVEVAVMAFIQQKNEYKKRYTNSLILRFRLGFRFEFGFRLVFRLWLSFRLWFGFSNCCLSFLFCTPSSISDSISSRNIATWGRNGY